MEKSSAEWTISVCVILKNGLFYKCDKPHVRYLAKIQAHDFRSTFGKNVQNICKEAEVDSLSIVDTGSLRFSAIPEDENWKVLLIKECLEILHWRKFLK